MKNSFVFWLSALFLAFSLSSCDLLGGIYKAGFYSALVVVVLIVILLFWLIRRGRGRR